MRLESNVYFSVYKIIDGEPIFFKDYKRVIDIRDDYNIGISQAAIYNLINGDYTIYQDRYKIEKKCKMFKLHRWINRKFELYGEYSSLKEISKVIGCNMQAVYDLRNGVRTKLSRLWKIK